MSWTPGQRRRHAPALDEAVRANATVRPAATIDVIDLPARTGRPRPWSTPTMVQAPWRLCRAGAAWALLPSSCPPRQAIGSRLARWVRLGALAVLDACLRLARGRNRRPSAGILDTQSVRAGPQAGPRGQDANKKVPTGPPDAGRFCWADRIDGAAVDGRKRGLPADTEGLVQALRVVPASVQDRDTPPGPHRAGAGGGRPAQGPGRPRLRRRARRGPAGPPPHRPRAGRAQGQDRLRGRATPVEDRADLRLSPTLPAPAGRSRRQHRDVADHHLARRLVHDRCSLREAEPGLGVFGTALRMAAAAGCGRAPGAATARRRTAPKPGPAAPGGGRRCRAPSRRTAGRSTA